MLDGANTQVALRKSLPEILAEYDEKRLKLADLHAAFKQSIRDMERGTSIDGAYGGALFSRGAPDCEGELNGVLLRSAWRNIHDGLNINRLATANDRRKIDSFLEKPTAFTIENIREVFGDYLLHGRWHILRGLAEVFCGLDDFYKSHSKVRVGVKGLPKRVIVGGFNGYSDYGRNKVSDIINALETYRGNPRLEHRELYDALPTSDSGAGESTLRGLKIRRFSNGNAHIYFDDAALLSINRALGEFYGDVLPDESGEKPEQRTASTAVSKDLQYYRTSDDLATRVVAEVHVTKGMKALEPSCGDGSLMKALRAAGADVFGIEFDAGRVAQARANGFSVLQANFLDVPVDPTYDLVVMNPPFYGRHYVKHVEHAKKFLKPGGTLLAILPATAQYDHGDLKGGSWRDLPIGSFRDSGTNINTVLHSWHLRSR